MLIFRYQYFFKDTSTYSSDTSYLLDTDTHSLDTSTYLLDTSTVSLDASTYFDSDYYYSVVTDNTFQMFAIDLYGYLSFIYQLFSFD